MQSTQTPILVPLAWAANGTKNTIPEASQIAITPGAASLNDGFPPLTMTPIAAGGVPPAGADFNGVLNLITQTIRWMHAGGALAWNSAFAADANVLGYPMGAHVARADLTGWWISTVENNQTNPDATDGSAAGWVPGFNYGATSISGLTNTDVTLTPAQAAKSRIILAGTLTGSINLIFPKWTKEWQVVNNTTGAFTITAKTPSGTGVTVPRGQVPLTGDGANITQPALSVATGTLPTHAAQLGQVAGIVGSARSLTMNVAAASSTATLTADELIVETALGGVRYCLASLSQSINLATVGAGGMDTGTAPTSGFVAIYAIYNPTTGARALLATAAPNSPAAAAGAVYGGAYMPAGYSASALVSVWPTDSSGRLAVAYQADRTISIADPVVLSTNSTASSTTPLWIAAAVPANARKVSGSVQASSTTAANLNLFVHATSTAGIGQQGLSCSSSSSSSVFSTGFRDLPLSSTQVLYYTATSSASGPYFQINICDYTF